MWKSHAGGKTPERREASGWILAKVEKQRLIDCCADHLRPIVIRALNTGMRRSEILKLGRDHVDFRNNQMKSEKTQMRHFATKVITNLSQQAIERVLPCLLNLLITEQLRP
ncbi:hypothetical protein ES707_19334 [subsurface metagenome]